MNTEATGTEYSEYGNFNLWKKGQVGQEDEDVRR